jgi:hypothetical protein
MTVMTGEDPALPEAEIDECEAVIACLGDDAALLRRDNPDCEIAANMDAAADRLEKLRELQHDAMRALVAWDGTVLPKAHDGMMQERMECLRAALAGLGA